MKNPSILIVDDESDNFDVIEAILSVPLDKTAQSDGYDLHYVDNGEGAIAALETFKPDVILLDVMMPGMDGLETCRQIKAMARWKAVPIIMVTALSSKEDLARCLQAGADDFVSKPVNSMELRARVQSMLRIKQQYDLLQSFSELQRNTINILGNSLQELRGNLTSTFPHELNTPLNGLLGGLDLVLGDLENMSTTEIRELLNLSYFSARRLEKLTQKFLNYLSLEVATAMPGALLRMPSMLITPIVQNEVQRNKRFEDLICEIEDADLAVVSNYVQWLLEELLDNACKFSEPGTSITVRGAVKEGRFHLWVINQGRGMSNEQISKIGAFMQFDRASYEQRGVGLGLAIAKKVASLYGGRLQLTSIPQQETTIHLSLPLVSNAV